METVLIAVVVILFVVSVFVLRTVFRINEIVESHKKTNQLLIKLVQLKKQEMGIADTEKVKEK